MKNLFERRSAVILTLLIVCYVAYFSLASIFRYKNFLFQNFDLAIGNQILWNLLHGSMDCSIRGGNFFGDHFRPVFFLYLPFYLLFQDPKNLLFLQSLILGLGAVPAFLIAGRKLGRPFGLLFAFLYLFNPLVGYVNLFEFHPEAAVTTFLLFAIYFFLEKRFVYFLIFTVLALFCKENVSFIIFMMGFWALFQKRQLRWHLATFLLGIVWFVLSFKIAIPYFSGGEYAYFNLYGYLGNSFSEVVKTFVRKPLFVLGRVFVMPNLKYLFDVFVQFGFLPLLSPLSLLPSVPPFLQILLSHARGVPEIYTHYSAKLIPFLFTAAVLAVEKIARLGKAAKPLAAVYMVSFSLFFNWYYGPHLNLPKKWSEFKAYETAEIKKGLVEKVPEKADIVATFDFLPSLSGREGLYSFHYLYWGHDQLMGKKFTLPETVDFALIDFNDFNIFWSVYSPRGDENMRKFFEGGWGVIDGADTMFLLKKVESGAKLYEALQEPSVQTPLIMNLNDRIILIGYDARSLSVKRGEALEIFTYFQQTNPAMSGQKVYVNKNYGVYFQLDNEKGETVLEKKRPLCYGIYPNMKWQEGETIKELNLLYIPRGIPDGEYSLNIGTYESKIDSFKMDRQREEKDVISKDKRVLLLKFRVAGGYGRLKK